MATEFPLLVLSRLSQLQHFLERAELLLAARSDSNNLTAPLSAYEATVVARIEALETEMDEDEREQLERRRKSVVYDARNPPQEEAAEPAEPRRNARFRNAMREGFEILGDINQFVPPML